MLKENEEYEYSQRSEGFIKAYWPDRLNSRHAAFDRRMMELQIRLIEGHMQLMRKDTLARARDTVSMLQDRIRGRPVPGLRY